MDRSVRLLIMIAAMSAFFAATPAVVPADVFMFEDGTFDEADWTVTSYIVGIGGGETEWIHEITDGNPDDYARVILITFAETNVAMAFQRNGFSFEPSTEGVIGTVDYHEDARLLIGEAEGMYSYPLIFQGGLMYVAAPFTVPETEWTAKERLGMRAEDFWMIDSDLIVYPETNPDFGTGGTPIEFGFLRSAPSEVDTVRDAGIDNWSFTITTVDPIAFCGPGQVNMGCGSRGDVLFVNGETGGEDRVIEMADTTPLSGTIIEPPSHIGDGRDTKACIYVWLGQPGVSDIVTVPKDLGTMCYGPFLISTKVPKKVWNGIGFAEKLGAHTGPGAGPLIVEGSPFEFFASPSGLGRTVTATFQGIIEDHCSVASPIFFSVTNGFVLRVTSP